MKFRNNKRFEILQRKKTAVAAVNQMPDAQELNTKQESKKKGNLPPLVDVVDLGSDDGPGT